MSTLDNLNTILKDSNLYNSNLFKSIEPTPTRSLDPSFLKYCPSLKILFCSICFISIKGNSNLALKKHLEKEHSNYIKTIDKELLLEKISTIFSLNYNSIEDLKDISPNTYYYPYLELNLNGFKCINCNFTSLTSKTIRDHLNTKHSSLGSKGIKTLTYLENIPLQIIKGLDKNLKITFIPKLPILEEAPKEIEPKTPINTINSLDTINSKSNILISSYLTKVNSIYKEESKKDTILTSNPNTSNFIKNSRFNYFIKDKDLEVLTSLLSTKFITSIYLDFYKEVIIGLGYTSSSLIYTLDRSIRQDLKSESLDKDYKELKDFIDLEDSTKPRYYKVFLDLFIYILNLYLIKSNPTKYSKELETIKDLEIPKSLEPYLDNFNKLDIDFLKDKEFKDLAKDKFILFFYNLLEVPIPFTTTKTLNSLNNLVISFLITRSIDTKEYYFKDIRQILNVTNILIYNSRLYYISYLNYKERTSPNINLSKLTTKDLPRLLSNKSNNYFKELTSIRAFSLSIVKDLSSNTTLLKDIDYNTLEIENIRVTLNNLKELFNTSYTKLEDILYKDLLFTSKESINIDITSIEDSLLLNNLNYSIIDNKGLENYKTYFINSLFNTRSTIYKELVKSINKDNTITYKVSNLDKFLRNKDLFLEYLALNIYLLGGSPLRGKELSTITYKNSRDSLRSLVLDKYSKLFRIETTYYKSSNISRKSKSSIRFLPRNLTNTLLIYLLIIDPFIEFIRITYFKKETLPIPNLLVTSKNIPISSITLSNLLREVSSKILSKGLTIKPYRQIISRIIKTRLNYNIDISSSENEDLIEDKMSNRSTKTSYNNYSRDINLGKSINLDTLEQSKNFCLAYFKFFSIDNYTLETTSKDFKLIIPKSSIDYTLEDTLNIENTITSKENSLEYYLKEYFNNPKAEFRDLEQKKAIISIIKNNPYTTYINRTSSGKSLLFLLPSFIYKDRTYLVITPRVSLKKDLYNKAIARNIKASILEENLDSSSTLIFISLESILSNTLETLINSLKDLNKEITIFLDEIHLFLLEKTYRKILRFISSIRKFRVSLVFISATLPKELATLLTKEFNITKGYNLIRANTSRPNISYRLNPISKNSTLLETIKDLLSNTLSSKLTKDNKCLVFINNEKQGLYLSKELDLDFYYSKSSNKDTILEEFLENPYKKVLLTTSILEVGVDFNIISYIIYLDPISSLLSIVQSIGRIRNKGIGFIISKETSKDPLKDILKLENKEDLDIEEFITLDKTYSKLLLSNTKCLRSIINRFLDNTITTKCNSNLEELYSFCYNKEDILNTTYNLELEKTREINTIRSNLETKLHLLGNTYCLYCLLILKDLVNYNHSLEECPKKSLELLEAYKGFKNYLSKSKILKPNYSCFNCLLPYTICSKLKDLYKLEDKCLYSSLIFYIYLLLYPSKELFKDILKDYNIYSYTTREDFISILFSSTTFYNLDTIRLIEVIYRIDIPSLLKKVEDLESSSSSNNSSTSSKSISSIKSKSLNIEKGKGKEKVIDLDLEPNLNLDIEDNLASISLDTITSKPITNTTKRPLINLSPIEKELDTSPLLKKSKNSNFKEILDTIDISSKASSSSSSNYSIDLDLGSNIEMLDELESNAYKGVLRAKKTRIINNLKDILLKKLEICIFCSNNNNPYNHLIILCPNIPKTKLETIDNILLKARQNFSKKVDLENSTKIKTLDSRCFLPLEVCYSLRKNQDLCFRVLKTYINNRYAICLIGEIVFYTYYFILDLELLKVPFINYLANPSYYIDFISNKSSISIEGIGPISNLLYILIEYYSIDITKL
jgi:superfamily II DNA or RNA helicase